jgi:hypothetical protein
VSLRLCQCIHQVHTRAVTIHAMICQLETPKNCPGTGVVGGLDDHPSQSRWWADRGPGGPRAGVRVTIQVPDGVCYDAILSLIMILVDRQTRICDIRVRLIETDTMIIRVMMISYKYDILVKP